MKIECSNIITNYGSFELKSKNKFRLFLIPIKSRNKEIAEEVTFIKNSNSYRVPIEVGQWSSVVFDKVIITKRLFDRYHIYCGVEK